MSDLALLRALEAEKIKRSREKFYRMYPATGQYPRSGYPKHMEVIRLSKTKPYIAFLGGNGVGKTELACYIATCHATGLYPDWWDGWKLTKPSPGAVIIMAGENWGDTRKTVQLKLLGSDQAIGTGILPGALFSLGPKVSGSDAYSNVLVKHVSGATTTIQFKNYAQGREGFQGFEADYISLDEQAPPEIIEECLMRFRGPTVDGRLLLTFTALQGMTESVTEFVPDLSDKTPEAFEASGKTAVFCGWDHVPHISETEIKRKLANLTSEESQVRSTGMPARHNGLIFPVPAESFVVKPFLLPEHWPRAYGLDYGFTHPTAVIWGAINRDTGVTYIYDEYAEPQTIPAVHAAAIMTRGRWIRGVYDPSLGKPESHGATIAETYTSLGLLMTRAVSAKAEEARAHILDALATGKLKIFDTCTKLLREISMYRAGKQVSTITGDLLPRKKNDDLIDALKYFYCGGGLKIATIEPKVQRQKIHTPEFSF